MKFPSFLNQNSFSSPQAKNLWLIHTRRTITLTLCLTIPSLLEADIIQLKNGRRMTGKVVKQTTERIILDVGTGTVTFRLTEIASIERDVQSPGAGEAPLTPVGPSIPPEPRWPTPTAGVASTPATRTADELLRLAEELLPLVAQLRGLPPQSPITKRVVNQAAIRDVITQALTRQHTAEELANKGKALIAFGLLPASANLQELLVQLYTQQAAGLYDPSTKILYLADWIPAPLQAGTVAHELVHALQDQHFDLAHYLDEVKDDSDATTARQAVIEGEALAVMLEAQLKDHGRSFTSLGDVTRWTDATVNAITQHDPSLAEVPAFLRAWMVFPYLYGMRFIQAVRTRGPWSAMARLYHDPPRSTEQIMHPDKYLSRRDDPTPIHVVDLRASLGKYWKRIDEDVVGELTIRCLLRQALDEDTATIAAEGWGGDRYDLYEEATTTHVLLVWFSVWDSAADAQQFTDAYRSVIAKNYPEARLVEGQRDWWRTAHDEIRLERRDAYVLMLESPLRPDFNALISQLWRSVSEGHP